MGAEPAGDVCVCVGGVHFKMEISLSFRKEIKEVVSNKINVQDEARKGCEGVLFDFSTCVFGLRQHFMCILIKC